MQFYGIFADARTDQVSAISTATRIAAGIAALLVSLLLLGSCCAWKSRQQKSTNFDKLNEMLFQNNHEKAKFPVFAVGYF